VRPPSLVRSERYGRRPPPVGPPFAAANCGLEASPRDSSGTHVVYKSNKTAGRTKARAGRLEPDPLVVDDIAAEVERLRATGVSFRNDIIRGPGGKQTLLDDPSGNPIELFQPAR
jgi:Glyoxalase/Bleomycin resistance protein/Dioxygenase superfamily